MQKIITLRTDKKNGLYDITAEVVSLIKASKVRTALLQYMRGARQLQL